MKRILLAAFLTVGTALGCGTSYHAVEQGSLTGYSDTSIGSDRLRVTFTGIGSTGRDVIHQYGLLRAAEIAEGKGFSKLQVISDTLVVIKRGYKGQNRLYRCIKEVRFLTHEGDGRGVVDVAEVIAKAGQR